jgi:hypothetical protein
VDGVERFYVLVGLIVLIGGALAAIGRLLWKLSAQWNTAVHELADLGEDIKSLIDLKEREHTRLADADAVIAARLERHEQWHHDIDMVQRRPGYP